MHLGLAVPFACIAVISYYGFTKPACFPWPDAAKQEPLSCDNNPTRRVQTISEMTARTGITAELLSAAAAATLIGVYAALAFIRERLPGTRTQWRVVEASFAVGALGFVGLTVWSLRVNGGVHTCFTAQTIIAIFIQVSTLIKVDNPLAPAWSLLTGVWLSMLVAMGYYIITNAAIDAPEPTVAAGYFDSEYFQHAYGQFVFFAMYFVLLTMIVNSAERSGPRASGRFYHLQ